MTGGAYEELSQTGEPGPKTLELLLRMVHQVRRASGFPPPEGYTLWSDDAAYDVITAMLTREGAGQKFVTACFALAISEATLERLFLASIKNFLIDEAKKTPRGKLRLTPRYHYWAKLTTVNRPTRRASPDSMW